MGEAGDALDALLADLTAEQGGRRAAAAAQGPPSPRSPGRASPSPAMYHATYVPSPGSSISPSVSRGPPPTPPPRTGIDDPSKATLQPDLRLADGIQEVANIIGATRLVEDARPAAPSYSVTGTDQSRQGPLCERCNAVIMGEWLNVGGRMFHPNHLLCDSCGLPIGTAQFAEQNGRISCQSCASRTAQSCADCGQPIISGERTQAMGLYFHRDHFRCNECRAPLSEFFERGGKAYCPADFYRRHGRHCAGCMQPIGQHRSLKAFDKDWHNHCFRCSRCSSEIGTGAFYPDNGRPRCAACGPR